MTARIAVLLIAGAVACARADIVDMHYSVRGPGQNLRITTGDRTFTGFAGQLLHEVTGGTGIGEELVGLNRLYGVDLFEHTAGASSEFVIAALTEVPDSRPMSPGAALALGSIFAEADEAQFAADVSDDYAAAFQIAVWEIVSDFDADLGAASLDLSSGWFRASSRQGGKLPGPVSDYAASFFAAVDAGARYHGEIFALRSGRLQDQIGSRVVPTPGSAAVFSLGLVLAVHRRRG